MKQTIQHIAIVHAWHDDNRGDSAILIGMLTALYKQWPNAHISLISSFASDDPAFECAYRHTLAAFSDLEIVPAPFWAYCTLDRRSKVRQIKTLLSGLQALFHLILPASLKLSAIQHLVQADLILAAGGHSQPVTQNSFKSCYLVFKSLYFLFLAKRYEIPYGLFGQSFDLRGIQKPSGGQYLQTRPDAQLLRSVLSHAVAIWPRDVLSLQALVALEIPKSQLTLVADSAFCLSSANDEQIQEVLSFYGLYGLSYWVLTVKQCSLTCLQEICTLIQRVLDSGKVARVVLVAQSFGPTVDEDDRQANRSLVEHLRSRDIAENQVILIEDDLTPSQLVTLYGGAEFVVGMRLQSVILSFVAGTPAYAIAYTYPKVQGLMSMMDMEHLYSTVETFSAATAIAQIEATNIELLRQHIPVKVQTFRNRILDAVNAMDKNFFNTL